MFVWPARPYATPPWPRRRALSWSPVVCSVVASAQIRAIQAEQKSLRAKEGKLSGKLQSLNARADFAVEKSFRAAKASVVLGAAEQPFTQKTLKKLRVAQLRALCTDRSLAADGIKAALVERLLSHQNKQGEPKGLPKGGLPGVRYPHTASRTLVVTGELPCPCRTAMSVCAIPFVCATAPDPHRRVTLRRVPPLPSFCHRVPSLTAACYHILACYRFLAFPQTPCHAPQDLRPWLVQVQPGSL